MGCLLRMANATQEMPSLCESIGKNALAPFLSLVSKINSSSASASDVPPVTCIVSDGFMSFTITAGEELGIPVILFFTLSACGFMSFYQWPVLVEKGLTPLKGTFCIGFDFNDLTWLTWTLFWRKHLPEKVLFIYGCIAIGRDGDGGVFGDGAGVGVAVDLVTGICQVSTTDATTGATPFLPDSDLSLFHKFVNDLHGLISPTSPGTPLPLVLVGKSKNALLSTFLFLDQFVWLSRTGIYKSSPIVKCTHFKEATGGILHMEVLKNGDKPHVVCIPSPFQSHIKAMLKLAQLLHHKGFHITFVNTEYNHKRFLKARGPNSLDGFPDFQFETIPDGLPPSDSADSSQCILSLCESIRKNMLSPFLNLVAMLNDKSAAATSSGVAPPVTCIVSDGFMSFTITAGEELGIPVVMFFTLSACGFMGFYQFHALLEKGLTPLKGMILLI
ncbi:hypothetical protein RHMOL_Rhmol12G0005500 [Rhododendron molle]|uniref:Uncharacterized protein n=1 Tax=Rhododendron molle TaxID=49168 RepID=A0ACC0LDA2_RHOML|nr:hypothetical protein RHMOL_Rhmol12G0005500 [Rhododendron molle]